MRSGTLAFSADSIMSRLLALQRR